MSKDYLEEAVIEDSVNLRVTVGYWEQADDNCDAGPDDCNTDGDCDFTITYPVGASCHAWNHYAWVGQDDQGEDEYEIHPNSAGKMRFDGKELSFRQWTTISCQGGANPGGTEKVLEFRCLGRDYPCDIAGRIIGVEMPNILTNGWSEESSYGAGTNLRVATDNNGYYIAFYNGTGSDLIAYGAGRLGCDQLSLAGIYSRSQGHESAGAINDHGDVCELRSDSSGLMYFDIGSLHYERLEILFEHSTPPKLDGFEGDSPSVSIDNDGNIVVFCRNPTDGLIYCVGKLDRSARAVEWGEVGAIPVSYHDGPGPSFTMDNNGNFCTATCHDAGGDLYTTVAIREGKIDFEGKELKFKHRSLLQHTISGVNIEKVSFDINDNGYGVLGISLADRFCEVLYKAGLSQDGFRWGSHAEKISESDFQDGREMSISMNNEGKCVRGDRRQDGDNLYLSMSLE